MSESAGLTGRPGASSARVRLGVIADPDAPEQVARRLAETLPGELEDGREWVVEVDVNSVVAGKRTPADILRAAGDRRREQGWDYAICVTDLPVRIGHHPVVADVNVDAGVAVVSLPALGAMSPYRRTQRMVLRTVADLAADPAHGVSVPPLSSIRREATSAGSADVRYRVSRGWGRLRLVAGMVRTNRPWRLIFGLSGALAAAAATSAFGLTSSTIWQIGDQLSVLRQIVAALVAIVVLMFWLIAGHGLWETRRSGSDREQARLYNASTVLTLFIGVATMYALLFVINLAVASFLIPSGLVNSTLGHPESTDTYLSLAWAFTTMGVIAGALGSSLESDSSVRHAAYGYREQQRRARRQTNNIT